MSMNLPDQSPEKTRNSGPADRYIFRPKKHLAWTKGLFILLFLIGWGIAMLYFAHQTQEIAPTPSQAKEKQLDWRQRPGTRYRSSIPPHELHLPHCFNVKQNVVSS